MKENKIDSFLNDLQSCYFSEGVNFHNLIFTGHNGDSVHSAGFRALKDMYYNDGYCCIHYESNFLAFKKQLKKLTPYYLFNFCDYGYYLTQESLELLIKNNTVHGRIYDNEHLDKIKKIFGKPIDFKTNRFKTKIIYKDFIINDISENDCQHYVETTFVNHQIIMEAILKLDKNYFDPSAYKNKDKKASYEHNFKKL
jgi:hypothetical protein